MVRTYTKHFNTRQTPQTELIPGTTQVPNSAWGYSFAVDDWTRLERFLILGSSGGSYYASEKKLTVENAEAVIRCVKADGPEAVRRIAGVSVAGRAPKNDPAIFALALAASMGDQATKTAAYTAVSSVCRIGTHLFQFASACDALRGWGKGLRKSIQSWYSERDARDLAYQATKYQQRDGWSHRDLLRLSHPKFTDETHQTIAHWIVKGWQDVGDAPHPNQALLPIWAMERAKRATSDVEIARLIHDYRLVRECVPTQWLNSPLVWEALVEEMPVTAMVRNLGKMTAVGLLTPFSYAMKKVVTALTNDNALKKARVHPLNLLVALRTYSAGRGEKGSLTWQPVAQVKDALNKAFYLSFGAVRPTGKNWFLGIDVSGSMSSPIAGTGLSCCEAATALAMLTAKVEPWTYTGAFNCGIREIPLGSCTSLDSATHYTRDINGGGTDCSLPMLHAMERRMKVDAFVVLTDNETWANPTIHPCQALQQYRDKMGVPAKLIVLAMTANNFSIANPEDSGMLDCVGFDLSVPQVMSEFVGYADAA
jgi:60 kDa SS-A/Ro ribonucleoprotein